MTPRIAWVCIAVAGVAIGAAFVFRGHPATFEEVFEARLAAGVAPGGWVVVVRDGKANRTLVYGQADLEAKVPVTAGTYMHIGSVGKMFTAACVMRLVDDGKLKLDDPVAKFLPKAPESWKAITVRRLLNQTSGLPDYLRGVLDYDAEYTEDAMLERIETLEPVFAPGSRWEYSNTNYLLLGLIVHRASGLSYCRFLRERVLDPAGVKSVRCEGDLPAGAAQSKGYWGTEPAHLAHPASKSMSLTADGCLWANVDGMVQWDRAIDRMDRLPKGLTKLFWTPAQLPDGASSEYGAGWSVEKRNGREVVWHNGGWQGFSAFYARFPKERLSIVLCTNGGDVDDDDLGFELADLALAGK